MAAAGGQVSRGRRVRKSASAFRTISEVAAELDTPQHVLRFWETKFTQVKPLKRGGGRRYYRPEDVALLRRIKQLLYDEGYTIKGVQRLLRDGGAKGLLRRSPVPAAPAAEVVLDAAKRAELERLMAELTELRDLLRAERE